MPANHVSSATFQQEVLEEKLPVLVDFFATWCGPCKMAGPVLDTLADEFAGKVKIVKVDVDENGDLAQQYQVMSIPSVKMFVNGQVTDTKVGYGGEQGYRAMIQAVLK
ncbi:MAG: Thioredoxin [Microgenomates group bacterium GW2011_GWF2_45_18]|nr:MAG: Thioredoxin [Microgenomates group bacterium GW2011_GWF1_44_10]KKU01693.1 MAG: Thioredoxin [Microgenomates group bacterium GW2011_GWF2_45_18]OGJ41532.1 MAG: thioredoxin [Candidatus Pacebacteria bacterium RIFOXYB1_FULL_44_10]HAU99548.1 thioredoxin [Candidatus Paceibacterota bacterium]HAX01472.1 thioredoxin [Candidatus Paceibacterota bacterium]